MHTVAKNVGSGGEVLGTCNFPVFDSTEEMTERYGAEGVLKLAQRALDIDLSRVARDAMSNDKSEAEAQALIDSYKVGGRGGKPTMKTFLALLTEFGNAKQIDLVLKGQNIYQDDGLEAAFAFLMEHKNKGVLNK